jgi:hypothetical protein
MMAKSKAINVKIATVKVIKALENKLEQIKTTKQNEAENETKFQKLLDKYNKEVTKIALANMNKWGNLNVKVRWDGDVNVDVNIPGSVLKLPAEPIRDFDIIPDWQYKDMVDEIENAIRILKMTDEEVVSTSTYNSIAKYL